VSRERLRARADRVNAEADLGQILYDYGYAVMPDRQREQQFACDLHGVDNKPSARFYGPSNSTWCFVCHKTLDPIGWVMAKEGLNFQEAIKFLEKQLGLGVLPWSDEAERPKNVADEIDELSKQSVSFQQEQERLNKLLLTLTRERDFDQKTLLTFWEVFDRVGYGVARENWGDAKGLEAIGRLRERVMGRLKETS
jgi:DNA primase